MTKEKFDRIGGGIVLRSYAFLLLKTFKIQLFAEVVNAYGQTVAKRNIIDEEIK